MEDISFTQSNLTNNKLILQNAVVGGFAVEDNTGQLVIPPQKRTGELLEVDFTGFTIQGTWKIRFFQGEPGVNTTGGISSNEAILYALLLG